METKTTNKHLRNFYIAGFTYHEGCLAINMLKIGTPLKLVREKNNSFDPNAVAIYFKEYKLGYIPATDNELVCNLLDLGYSNIFDLRVQRLSPDQHPEKQVGVVLFIKPANKAFNR